MKDFRLLNPIVFGSMKIRFVPAWSRFVTIDGRGEVYAWERCPNYDPVARSWFLRVFCRRKEIGRAGVTSRPERVMIDWDSMGGVSADFDNGLLQFGRELRRAIEQIGQESRTLAEKSGALLELVSELQSELGARLAELDELSAQSKKPAAKIVVESGRDVAVQWRIEPSGMRVVVDYDRIPDAARFAAIDASGKIYAYDSAVAPRATAARGVFMVDDLDGLGIDLIGDVGSPVENWADTLIEIPRR